jgi:hypothetical protein
MQNKCCWALTVFKNTRRACGIHKDEKDIGGCWKGKGRVSDAYNNVELPYPDAKVAAVLCGGGPCTNLCFLGGTTQVAREEGRWTFIRNKRRQSLDPIGGHQ